MLEAHKTWKQTPKTWQIYAKTAFDILSRNNKNVYEEELKGIFVCPNNLSKECRESWPNNDVNLNTILQKLQPSFPSSALFCVCQEFYYDFQAI